jgi:hypothetical protein
LPGQDGFLVAVGSWSTDDDHARGSHVSIPDVA